MEPGIVEDLPNLAYHAETEWLSSSQIKRHLPEQFKASEATGAKDFGTLFHNEVLGTSDPMDIVDAATWTGKAAKEAQEAAWAAGKIAILAKDVPTIKAMAAAVEAHDEARRLLMEEPGLVEVSVFAEDYRGLRLKARYDRLLDSDGIRTGVDLKSFTGKPGSYSIAKATIDWGYDVQQDHYEDVAAAAGIPLDGFRFVFVSKEPPHYVMVANLDPDFSVRGRTLRERGIDRMLNPEMTPAYEGATGTLNVRMPNWARL